MKKFLIVGLVMSILIMGCTTGCTTTGTKQIVERVLPSFDANGANIEEITEYVYKTYDDTVLYEVEYTLENNLDADTLTDYKVIYKYGANSLYVSLTKDKTSEVVIIDSPFTEDRTLVPRAMMGIGNISDAIARIQMTDLIVKSGTKITYRHILSPDMVQAENIEPAYFFNQGPAEPFIKVGVYSGKVELVR